MEKQIWKIINDHRVFHFGDIDIDKLSHELFLKLFPLEQASMGCMDWGEPAPEQITVQCVPGVTACQEIGKSISESVIEDVASQIMKYFNTLCCGEIEGVDEGLSPTGSLFAHKLADAIYKIYLKAGYVYLSEVYPIIEKLTKRCQELELIRAESVDPNEARDNLEKANAETDKWIQKYDEAINKLSISQTNLVIANNDIEKAREEGIKDSHVLQELARQDGERHGNQNGWQEGIREVVKFVSKHCYLMYDVNGNNHQCIDRVDWEAKKKEWEKYRKEDRISEKS